MRRSAHLTCGRLIQGEYALSILVFPGRFGVKVAYAKHVFSPQHE
jgi:hypothetical protein